MTLHARILVRRNRADAILSAATTPLEHHLAVRRHVRACAALARLWGDDASPWLTDYRDATRDTRFGPQMAWETMRHISVCEQSWGMGLTQVGGYFRGFFVG